MSSPLHLDVHIDDSNPEQQILKLIHLIRPKWINEDVQLRNSPKDATRGVLNTIIIVFVDPQLEDAIVVRIHTTMMGEFMKRDKEAKNIMRIHNLYGFAPDVVAVFSNGFCYKYIHGEVLSPQTVRLGKVWRIIAKQMALVHSTSFSKDDQEPSKFDEFFSKALDGYPEALKNPESNKRLQTELPKKDFLICERNEVKEFVSSLGSPFVFCHGDTRPENMIWNEKNDTVTFVDFESAGFAYQAQEVAYHFWRYAGIGNIDYSLYPDRAFQLNWLRLYLQTYNHKTKGNSDVTEFEIETLFVQVNGFYLLYLIESTGLVGYLNTMAGFDMIGIDIPNLCIETFNEYRRQKKNILSLKLPS